MSLGAAQKVKAGMSYERKIYRLLATSLILPPVFAVAPFGSSVFVFLGIGIAYYYLVIFVLPFAFIGLAVGFYLDSKLRNANSTFKERDYPYTAIGYLAGFVIGLEIVLFQFYPSIQYSPGLGSLVGLAAAGLLTSFIISKIGTSNLEKAIQSYKSIQPLDFVLSARDARPIFVRLRLFVIISISAIASGNVFIPLLL